MLTTLSILSLVSRVPYGFTMYHACIPNSQFHVNGRLCVCDAMGRWTEANCHTIRRQSCTPGQVIWKDCNQCICQENRHLLCTNMCSEDYLLRSQVTKSVDVKRVWCIPFVTYYVNCSLCVCPSTGKMKDARCATDAACPFRGVTDYLAAIKRSICIPKVMYLFPCLHCLCSDDGFFNVDKCVGTCQKVAIPNAVERCTSKTFYRNKCKICFCPDTGIMDDKLCTKPDCSGVQIRSLATLRNQTSRCLQQMFTGPKCFYCECSQAGIVNEMSCLEADCMSVDNMKYGSDRTICTPRELVLKCMDCFCLRTGLTDPKYCTEVCTNQQKLNVLETVIKESLNNRNIVDRRHIPSSDGDNVCEPNSIYKEQGKYCLCPDNGDTKFKLCTSVFEEITTSNLRGTPSQIDFNFPCVPNTFVEFDCNTCYCLKTGKIDPKWCTYDDCAAKKLIVETNRINFKYTAPSDGDCVPGTISKKDCNFCICSDSGLIKDRACTKSSCAGIKKTFSNDFTCEPLTYYNVDCNICYCPKSGFKNVARCTKQTCEKNFLRSEVCVPGRLFGEECNVCVCPPNGNKADSICTNNTCEDNSAPWKKIFKLSQSLLTLQVSEDSSRDLELCFPGEEFEVGCKVCLCPDMGLRLYATCTQMYCTDENFLKDPATTTNHTVSPAVETTMTPWVKRNDVECLDGQDSNEKKECTPGSMYIMRCHQCICPYMGSTTHFCRPLPEREYCEQAFSGINYMPKGRRTDEGNGTAKTVSTKLPRHNHTVWKCENPGRVMDECFVCECHDGILIEEHCFSSNDDMCKDRIPKFLKDIKPLYG